MNEKYTGHEQDDFGFQLAQRFIDATNSVSEYNRQHAEIGPQISDMFQAIAAEKFKNLVYEEPKVSPEEEAQMERELIQIIQKDELESMGISLFAKNASNEYEFDVDISPDCRHIPSSLFMLITDGAKFKDTLYRWNPTEEQKEKIEKQISELLGSTIKVVRATYPYKDSSSVEYEVPEVMQELLQQQINQFIDISLVLTQQSFDNGANYNTLKNYATRYLSGVLPEYREAETLRLSSKFSEYWAGTWVQDINDNLLMEKWTRAFDLMIKLRDREESASLFNELFYELRVAFDDSREWLDKKAEAEGRNEEYIFSLQKVMDQLQNRWTDDFLLENSFYLSEKQEKSE